MSIFPITPLVRRVQKLIIQTFDVPDQTAEDCAAELVALAEDWGEPRKGSTIRLDIPHQKRFRRKVEMAF